MKKTNIFLLTVFLLSSIVLYSCSDNTPNSTTGDTVTLRLQNSVHYYDTIDECINDADFIVKCTVSAIGETYLNGNPSLPEESDEEALNAYIRSIRTPIVLEINDIYYDSTDSLGDRLTVLEYRGTYNGYTLENQFPHYEEGKEYILFIKQAPDGETNIIMHQGSVEISSTPTTFFAVNSENSGTLSPMFNVDIFEDINTTSDIVDAIGKIK